MPIVRIVAAVLLPPLGVFLARGLGAAFWLNCLLTLIGFVPGVVHALYEVMRADASPA